MGCFPYTTCTTRDSFVVFPLLIVSLALVSSCHAWIQSYKEAFPCMKVRGFTSTEVLPCSSESSSFVSCCLYPWFAQKKVISRVALSKDMGNKELACPKPRHAAVGIGTGAGKPFRKLASHTLLPAEGEAGHEILEILFHQACTGDVGSPGSSIPFFHGSPPSRASNPLIHDVHFTQKKAIPSSLFLPQNFSCSSGGNSSYKKSSCSTSYGSKPYVRIEGFASSTSDAHRGVPTFA